MGELGLRGVVRGRRGKTTLAARDLTRPADRVNRVFEASQPNALRVADLTYVATWRGFVNGEFNSVPVDPLHRALWLRLRFSRRWAASGIPTTMP